MKKKRIGVIAFALLFAMVLVLTISKSKAETFHRAEQEELLQIEEWMIDEEVWEF